MVERPGRRATGSRSAAVTVRAYAPPAAAATPGRSAPGWKLAAKPPAATFPAGWTAIVDSDGVFQPWLSKMTVSDGAW
jgi:hypothetical protein